ncbi:ABC transporter substrate-binding protein [Desulfobacterales bacterium HSG16]|nr:ABC transporter substrate-binding protein [Desulfobacterales bacterium HSG16]
MEENSHIRILLAEDSRVIRNMEVETLNDIGYTNVITAENGQEAIQKITEEKETTLIISDWNMPDLDGYEFLMWVRSQEKYNKIPFIMATAHGERRQAAKAVKAGVTEFITKPFSGSELKNVIEKALGIKEKAVPDLSEKARRSHMTCSGKVRIAVAHIQITDHIILGVLKSMIMIDSPKHFELETLCMSSWNPVQDALEKGDADAAFMLAPIAMDLFRAGVDIKLLLLTHKNGSVCIKKKNGRSPSDSRDFFRGRTLYIPHILSVHHMLSDMFLREIGLNPGLVGNEDVNVFFEVVPPIQMPEFMGKSPRSGGFMVAEPMGAISISEGSGELLYTSGQLWENHPCCVLAMRNDFLEVYNEAVQEFVDLLIQAGQFVANNPGASSRIAMDFLDPARNMGLNLSVLEKILKNPMGIKTNDLFPVMKDLDIMQTYMSNEMGIGTLIDLEKFMDTSFAERSLGKSEFSGNPSIFHGPENITADILIRQADKFRPKDSSNKAEKILADSGTSRRIFEIMETESSITIKSSSEIRAIKRILRETFEFIEQFGIEIWPELRKVLEQLLINAIEHGNKSSIEKTIRYEITMIQNNLFKITVEDQGEGFDYQNLMLSTSKDLQNERHGFGIIRSFCEHIEFNEKGNRITIHMKTSHETGFDVKDEKGWKIITPSGSITASTVDRLKKLLSELAESKHAKYHFDFAKVEDIDSISLTVFVIFVKMLARLEIDAQLEITNSNDNLKNLFSMTRLDKYYMIF